MGEKQPSKTPLARKNKFAKSKIKSKIKGVGIYPCLSATE